jgi:F-type H+-transporting ATPase subunit a
MGHAGNARRIDMSTLAIAGFGFFEPAAHGLSQKAVEIARPFGFPITNSMFVTWMVALGLIIFAQYATRQMAQVPSGAQNFLEWLVESLYGLLESIIGRHLVERTFWFFASVFIFILAANWIGLLPGVGTVGWGHQTAHGFVIDRPLLRMLDRVGDSRNRPARNSQGAVCAQR